MLRISNQDLKIITDIRHDIHKHPEKSGEEFRTTEIIRNYISQFKDIEIIEFPIKTGLVARLKTGKNGKVIAIRSDIDALLQKEETEVDYKSLDDKLMHACGHDYHTAVNLGLVKLLSSNKKLLKGDVVFIFQRSEEITKGAKELIDLGLFEKVKIDYIFGFHNWPLIDYGKVIVKKGALMSTKTNFKIKIIGHGQHGSMPELNIDPIVCASNIVMSLQTIISRNTNPFDNTVLSVNSINGGSEDNLVVDRVDLSATIRSLSEKSLENSIKRMEEIVEYTAKSYRCKYKIEYEDLIPLVYNPEKMYEFVLKSVLKTLDKSNIIRDGQTMASEDFAFYMKKVPGFFYWFGSGEEGHNKEALHSRKFYCSDKAIKTAVEVIANTVIDGQDYFN
ncbi:amidohydrolase [Anaerococcus sp. AGMB00486]|uniref:Amidohydrolase n=2 Tax=Anaerococcus TaxID=165779 RepID=A0ABX2NC58_9FIRM|nr:MULTISPECIES: M20 family metallopeptidase [Anaerococcus]MDY3005718.1 M20 family metallopeptidase [Anaerococcus porci]MSS77941.1 amidohydrolase [Anaerococcus porci]NVF12306.1 amidohydrolase [Anaerococcus faecalis]